MKTFPNPAKSLQLMAIGIEIEAAAGAKDNCMLANAIYYHRLQKRPIKTLCEFIMDCYRDNPGAVVDIFGESLITKIKNTLQNE